MGAKTGEPVKRHIVAAANIPHPIVASPLLLILASAYPRTTPCHPGLFSTLRGGEPAS